jgi:hypothetical protein
MPYHAMLLAKKVMAQPACSYHSAALLLLLLYQAFYGAFCFSGPSCGCSLSLSYFGLLWLSQPKCSAGSLPLFVLALLSLQATFKGKVASKL